MKLALGILGILIQSIGWVLIWSQIPEGVFSKTGVIIIFAGILICIRVFISVLDNK